MFSKGYEISSNYTLPVLVSYRFFDGKIASGLGSFVVVNKDGWIITAAHILDSLIAVNKNAKEIQEYNKKVADIEKEPKLNKKAKSKKLRKVRANPKWITNASNWWGHDSHIIKNFHILRENDIAIGKIENFNPKFCKSYPNF